MATCILCTSRAIINQQDSSGRKIYNCPLCGMFVVSDLIERQVKVDAPRLAAYLMSRKAKDYSDIIFITFESNHEEKGYFLRTVPQILEYFPTSFEGRLHGALLNMAAKSGYPGEEVIISGVEMSPLFYVDKISAGALDFMLGALQERGWISMNIHPAAGFARGVVVTGRGWEQVDLLRAAKAGAESMYASAPSLGEKDEFWSALRKACRTCGYQLHTPSRAERKAEERRVVAPELIAHIKAAGAVVCELSGGEAEAYYAAGLARGQGKLCILTCRRSMSESLHVDTEKMCVLLWDTAEELSRQLTYMIQAWN